MGQSKDQHYNPSQLGKLNPLFRKIFDFVLVVCDIDMFLIYKGNYGCATDAKYKIFLRPELRLSPNNYDCRRANIRIPFVILISYLLFKFIIMIAIQITDIILIEHIIDNLGLDDEHLNMTLSPNATIEGFLMLDLARMTMPNYYKTAIKYVFNTGNLQNSAFWSLSTDQTIFQISLTIAVLYCFIILPRLFREVPLDGANLRFMLDPLREIKRIDIIIKQHSEKILIECPKNRTILNQMDQATDSLRPHTFSAKWYKSLCRYTMSLFIINFYCTLIFQLAFYYALFEIAKENLCIIRRLEQCNYSLVFTRSDIISFAEIFLGLGFAAVELVVLMVIISSNNICQLSLINSIEHELNQCLVAMSNAIAQYKDYRDEYFDHKRIQFSYSQLQERFNTASYLFQGDQHLKRQQDLEILLFRTYIKLVVALDEIKKTARLVGRSFESFLVLASLVILIAFLTNIVNGTETHLIQVVLLVIYWSLTNPILFACAFVFSRTVKLEKIAWSILANLSTYQATVLRKTNLRLYSSNEGLIGVLAKRWRRLVKSCALSDCRNSISPFGMNLTYRQVLRMNFAVISIVSLLRFF